MYPELLCCNEVRNNLTLSLCKVKKHSVQTISRKDLNLSGGLLALMFYSKFFAHPKSRLQLKWQVFPEFVITQEMESKVTLKKVKDFFKCGAIYPNERYDNHHVHLLKNEYS